MDDNITFWALLGYIGAFINALGGLFGAVWVLASYNNGDLPIESAVVYGGLGLTALVVTAPILGCLAKVTDTMTRKGSM